MSRMSLFVVQARLPHLAWCGRLSEKHAETRLRITSSTRKADGAVVETADISGEGWRQAFADLQRDPNVRDAAILESGEARALIRVTAEACAMCPNVQEAGFEPHVPVDVRAGRGTWVLVDNDTDRELLLRAVADAGAQVELSSDASPAPTLTRRQREILQRARDEGYYDFPRRITLTDLAGKLGIAKSTLSEALIAIESHVMRTQRRETPPPPVAAPAATS